MGASKIEQGTPTGDQVLSCPRVEIFRVDNQVFTVDPSKLEEYATPREVFDVTESGKLAKEFVLGRQSLILTFKDGHPGAEWVDAEVWDSRNEKED